MGMASWPRISRRVETAEARRLDATAENSSLATAASAIQDAWNLGLELHAWYLGIEKAGAPVLTINTDFGRCRINGPHQTMTVYLEAVVSGGHFRWVYCWRRQQEGQDTRRRGLDRLKQE